MSKDSARTGRGKSSTRQSDDLPCPRERQKHARRKTEVSYGRTALGQLVYDLGFAKLKDATIARKHGMTLAQVREARDAFKRGWRQGVEKRRRRERKRK